MNESRLSFLHDRGIFKYLFDAAHDLIHIAGPGGELIYVNDSWKRVLGYSDSEIEGLSIYKFVDKDYRIVFQEYRESIIAGQPTEKEVLIALNSSSGQKIFVEGFVAPRIFEGKVLFTSGIFRDVSGRVRNEAELRRVNRQLKEGKKNLEQLLFFAPDAVVVIDENSIITYWNPKAEQIFGWTAEEVIGNRLTSRIIPEQHCAAHDAGMKRYLQTGEQRVLNRTIEITAINKTGREFHISLTISTTYQNGNLAFVAFIRDVDDQKKTERELEEKRRQLEMSNRDLERFAHVASHDMKEPLRKIRTFIDRLNMTFPDVSPKESRKWIEKIDTAAGHLMSMIDSVLAFSSSKDQAFPVEKVNLDDIITQVENALEFVLEEKKGIIKRGQLFEVEGSSFLLYQLFYNLINNSLKFSRPDLKPLIEVTSSRDPASRLPIRIVVKDNGIGFSQEYSASIFDAFTRLHSKTAFEGTGLGLSICKNIVERHSGSIEAFGHQDEGASFIIQLPERQGLAL